MSRVERVDRRESHAVPDRLRRAPGRAQRLRWRRHRSRTRGDHPTREENHAGRRRFTKKRLDATAGPITIRLVNQDSHQHNIRIHTAERCCYDAGFKELGGTDTIVKGTTSAAVDLSRGKYIFMCSVPGHWEDGMWGRLTVR